MKAATNIKKTQCWHLLLISVLTYLLTPLVAKGTKDFSLALICFFLIILNDLKPFFIIYWISARIYKIPEAKPVWYKLLGFSKLFLMSKQATFYGQSNPYRPEQTHTQNFTV